MFVKNVNITLKPFKFNLFKKLVYDIAHVTILKENLLRKKIKITIFKLIKEQF